MQKSKAQPRWIGRDAWIVLTLLLPVPGTLFAVSPAAPAGRGGAVASQHPMATDAGLEILAVGGNAVDAAVATALALAVVFPEAGNLGGGGFAVTRLGGEVLTLDFRETAPARARHDMFLDESGEPIPGASIAGPLAAGVPGSPAGLFALHQRLGRLAWATVVEPARRLALAGVPVDRNLHDSIAEERQLLARFPETAALWLPGGEPPAVGSVVRLPALAATLAAYARRGPEALQRGPLAAAIEATSTHHGGVLTVADLEAYEPVWRSPLVFDAFGWRLASMALPSSGGIILGQTLHWLEALGWGALPRGGAERAHLLIEALRRAFADRYLLGDPATSIVGPQELLDPAWLARRRAEIHPDRATPSAAVASWSGPNPQGSGETTHVSVVDGEGGLVALTTTLNGSFGCGLFVPEVGIFLNNEMDDFAAAVDRPNLYGLIQGEANAVGPGKRMLSSMSPTIAWREGEGDAIALGGRGGSRIPTNTLQVLLGLLVDGDQLQAAVNRPRLHHQWLPDVVEVEEDTLSPETRESLERRGHQIAPAPYSAVVEVVRWSGDGRVEAAVDPRGPGKAGVVQGPG